MGDGLRIGRVEFGDPLARASDGWTCAKCGGMRYSNMVHHCATTIVSPHTPDNSELNRLEVSTQAEVMADESVALVYECRRCRRQYCVGAFTRRAAGDVLTRHVEGRGLESDAAKVHECDDRGRGLAEVIGHSAPSASRQKDNDT